MLIRTSFSESAILAQETEVNLTVIGCRITYDTESTNCFMATSVPRHMALYTTELLPRPTMFAVITSPRCTTVMSDNESCFLLKATTRTFRSQTYGNRHT